MEYGLQKAVEATFRATKFPGSGRLRITTVMFLFRAFALQPPRQRIWSDRWVVVASHRACSEFCFVFIRFARYVIDKSGFLKSLVGATPSLRLAWGNVDRQDRQGNMGAQNQLGEARHTSTTNDRASGAFLSRTENNREMKPAGRNDVLRTSNIWKESSNKTLALPGWRKAYYDTSVGILCRD